MIKMALLMAVMVVALTSAIRLRSKDDDDSYVNANMD